ncbi:MAG TPA: alpha-N-arabinofuranosidase [Sedimentisphaerales bacterium]|nr:alpha-N-arabinofuranosidase [Sedimentisphaerales bacterium]
MITLVTAGRTMKSAKLSIHPSFTIAAIEREIFGSFLEHMGRSVYTGIYEPTHPSADEQGFRRDVIALIRELDIPIIRYPGGNFVSGYNWRDGVGPKESRPVRLDFAWRAKETNQVGTNEFVDYCRKVGTQPMLAVNLGTGTPMDAANLVEYCNIDSGTALADLRVQHGWKKPHGVKVWCLGNEMDGHWQIGHMSAQEYGTKAREAAKLMRQVDHSVKLVACGSSARTQPTYPEWDRTILEYMYDYVDYISIHQYVGNFENDTANYLGCTNSFEAYIREVAATIDYVKAKRRSRRNVYISFDEWNVWYRQRGGDASFVEAPRQLEDIYNLEDALVVGLMLIALIRNADRVKVGCMAQLVNVIAPIMTEPGGPAIRQTIFWPYLHCLQHCRGTVLHGILDSPQYETKKFGDATTVDAVAVNDEEAGELKVFAVNRDLKDDCVLELNAMDFGKLSVVEHIIVDGEDLKLTNTILSPDRVVPRKGKKTFNVPEKAVSVKLPARSWNVVRFKVHTEK